MKVKYIKINEIYDLTMFCKTAGDVEGSVVIKREPYILNGKSLMNCMAADFTKGIEVEYPADAADFEHYISKFEVKKAN